ncbi:MAG: L-aspartate oxidase, partial [Acidobacteriota bacterium]|nr:L-aspartate oxidase [Acidobacteriota bacterium]
TPATPPAAAGDVAKAREQLQRAMTEGAGVVRSSGSLAEAGAAVGEVAAVAAGREGRQAGELANLAVVARALLAAAAVRTESRGAHARAEYPDPDPAWRCRLVQGAAGAGTGL